MRVLTVGIAAAITMISAAKAQDLSPHYTPHEQTANERLQTFTPPPPPPTTYPNISPATPNSDARLNLTPNTSLGGSLSPPSGNVRTTIGR